SRPAPQRDRPTSGRRRRGRWRGAPSRPRARRRRSARRRASPRTGLRARRRRRARRRDWSSAYPNLRSARCERFKLPRAQGHRRPAPKVHILVMSAHYRLQMRPLLTLLPSAALLAITCQPAEADVLRLAYKLDVLDVVEGQTRRVEPIDLVAY